MFDCLGGVDKAIKYGWYVYNTFEEREYNELKNFDKGDINVIVPREIIAFCSPISPHLNITNESTYNKPEALIPQFKKLQINTIFRFNDKIYEESVFKENGLFFFDLFFEDGQAPTPEVVTRFKDCIKKSKKGFGFHCKAGLGRTGTMIVIYMCEQFDITVREAVAWVKICRPGSINRVQYEFLLTYEANQNGKSLKESYLQATPNFKQVQEFTRPQSTNIEKPIRGFLHASDMKMPLMQRPPQRPVQNTGQNYVMRSRSVTPQMTNSVIVTPSVGQNQPIQSFTPIRANNGKQNETRSSYVPINNWDNVMNSPINNNRFIHPNFLKSDIIDYRDKEKQVRSDIDKNMPKNGQDVAQGYITPFNYMKISNSDLLKQIYSRNPNPPSPFHPLRESDKQHKFNEGYPQSGLKMGRNDPNSNPANVGRHLQPNSRRPPMRNPADVLKQIEMPLRGSGSTKDNLYLFNVDEINKHGHSVPARPQENPLNQKWV